MLFFKDHCWHPFCFTSTDTNLAKKVAIKFEFDLAIWQPTKDWKMLRKFTQPGLGNSILLNPKLETKPLHDQNNEAVIVKIRRQNMS